MWKEREREGGRDISWEPPRSGRLIEALCGSRLRAVTPMKSPFAAFCRLCAEFWLCYQKLQPQTGTVTESSPNPTHTHTCTSCIGIHNIHPIALLSSSQITCNRFRDILNTSSSHRVWIWMTVNLSGSSIHDNVILDSAGSVFTCTGFPLLDYKRLCLLAEHIAASAQWIIYHELKQSLMKIFNQRGDFLMISWSRDQHICNAWEWTTI